MARDFTGTDRVALGSLAISTTLSFCAWIKGPSGANPVIAVFRNSSNVRVGLNATTAMRLFLAAGSPAVWEVASAVHGMTLANWNHIAWTIDGSSAGGGFVPKFYANGVEKAVTTITAATAAIATAAGNTFLGNGTASNAPAGTMEWGALHSVELSAGEIQQAMHHGYTPRGLSWCLPFLGDATEPDISGLKRNGTVTGTTVVPGAPIRPRRMLALAS